MRIDPTNRWLKKATKEFEIHAAPPPSHIRWRIPNKAFLVGLYRQGYSAKQAGKLQAYLQKCESQGDKLNAFSTFHDGFLLQENIHDGFFASEKYFS